MSSAICTCGKLKVRKVGTRESNGVVVCNPAAVPGVLEDRGCGVEAGAGSRVHGSILVERVFESRAESVEIRLGKIGDPKVRHGGAGGGFETAAAQPPQPPPSCRLDYDQGVNRRRPPAGRLPGS